MFELTYGFLLARRVLLSASILFTSCCLALAQTDTQATAPASGPAAGQMQYHRHGVERQVKHLTRMLSLTPDQQTQVKAILAEQRQQMQQLRGASAQNGQAAQPDREQIRSIRQDSRTKIEALLNDDQKTKFEAWIQQRQQRMQQRHGSEGQQAAPSNAPGE